MNKNVAKNNNKNTPLSLFEWLRLFAKIVTIQGKGQ